MVGSCEHGNEPSGSIKFGEISCISDEFLASQGLCSMQLISWREGVWGFTPRKGLPYVEV